MSKQNLNKAEKKAHKQLRQNKANGRGKRWVQK